MKILTPVPPLVKLLADSELLCFVVPGAFSAARCAELLADELGAAPWHLRMLNTRLRFCRYAAGQYFHRHFDSFTYRSGVGGSTRPLRLPAPRPS